MTIREQITLESFRAFCQQPENRDRLFELIDGDIVEKMASFTPSRIAINIAAYLRMYLLREKIGYLTGADGGYILSPGTVVMPDVGYISRARLPEVPEREVDGPPDLAVEVKSPTDRKRDLRRKAELYLLHGTRIVWLVFPDDQAVEVYADEADAVTVTIDDALDGGEVLPGLSIPVRDIFAE
jgi:Uma2 family endonuclease